MINLDREVVFEVVRSGLNDQGGNCTASRRQGNRGILRGKQLIREITFNSTSFDSTSFDSTSFDSTRFSRPWLCDTGFDGTSLCAPASSSIAYLSRLALVALLTPVRQHQLSRAPARLSTSSLLSTSPSQHQLSRAPALLSTGSLSSTDSLLSTQPSRHHSPLGTLWIPLVQLLWIPAIPLKAVPFAGPEQQHQAADRPADRPMQTRSSYGMRGIFSRGWIWQGTLEGNGSRLYPCFAY
ncbi:hypothetical protein B0J13DRAFT_657663 [Dactylonectria estremocensis]|uniref:Uncharacterized protein n=1 Tax=Dactylonectria estremocensis TaxID=1079267 RepID=A0A9P9D4V5_9HYPO|nr:hypothetical protein B0J13DRAFT_657663 [Dactylonectria estremocensis]